MSTQAYIISTGTELLLGDVVETNSVFISRRLASMGIRVVGKSVVGDSRSSLEKAFRLGLEMGDIVIATGGLGPTRDDITKEVACEVMGCSLELRPEEVARIREFFKRRNRDMPESNLRQAMFPPEARVLSNPRGTAPGMFLEKDGRTVILLPGPPREMQPMFSEEVEPLLRQKLGEKMGLVKTRVIKVIGPGESKVEEMIKEFLDGLRGVSIALLAEEGEIHVRVTCEGEGLEQVETRVAALETGLVKALGQNVFGYDDDTLASVVSCMLRERGLRVAFAESCTGGLLAKMVTDLPGSSNIFWGGVVSYSNEAKIQILGVSPSTLASFGAVSPETAGEMAHGIRSRSGADIGIGITGIAGPDGGTLEKPVGLVYMGLADANRVLTKELRLTGGRESIRTLTAKSALDWLRRYLTGRG
ncbi:competence/damage-inducible protein CinA [Syntrophothermus lipocalidus DSM 12680]|uniref:Putative competence-damage inducible protein n=1 Tax=Syntrophothermus lipocalidus (strain DSM 12680 / TGB-C1) TaxID=643648 RepID=D7CM92_SYNLT|nr:competence/damage-inducible protein CinA [Syntrophothermus lipocalidus DSM 12680]